MNRLMGAALFALVLATGAAFAEPVKRVKDGDSLVIESGGREVEIRLAGSIDAPELNQAHGRQARAELRSLVEGREVELKLFEGDAYRRIIARVLVGGLDVSEEMVRRGFAWVRRAYEPAPELIRLEEQARAAGRGLWAEADPVPPWIWRKTAGRSRRDPKPSVIPTVECGAKRYCREMSSCEEALAHFQQCKLGRLDGDRNGIPCERLCRYYR